MLIKSAFSDHVRSGFLARYQKTFLHKRPQRSTFLFFLLSSFCLSLVFLLLFRHPLPRSVAPAAQLVASEPSTGCDMDRKLGKATGSVGLHHIMPSSGETLRQYTNFDFTLDERRGPIVPPRFKRQAPQTRGVQ